MYFQLWDTIAQCYCRRDLQWRSESLLQLCKIKRHTSHVTRHASHVTPAHRFRCRSALTFHVFARIRAQAEARVHKLIRIRVNPWKEHWCLTRLEEWAACMNRNIVTKKICIAKVSRTNKVLRAQKRTGDSIKMWKIHDMALLIIAHSDEQKFAKINNLLGKWTFPVRVAPKRV
jgi:hypothetical protein